MDKEDMEHKKLKDRIPPEGDTDSDSNDVIYVNPADHDGPDYVPTLTSRDRRMKKRCVKKPAMTAEDRHDQILRDAGFDTAGMSKQEKKEFVKVIMMSKDEATPTKKVVTDVTGDTLNSSSQNEHPFNRRDHPTAVSDVDSINETPQPLIKVEQSTVHQSPLNDEGNDGKSKNKAQRTKIVTVFSQNKVKNSRNNQGYTKDSNDEDADKELMFPKDMKQALPIKNVVVEKHQVKKGSCKRSNTQAKSVADERPKKQRKMEQYSHIVINEDVPNISPDEEEMMEKRKFSPKMVSSLTTEDDDTQPPDSSDVLGMESSEELKAVRVVSTPEEKDETTQEMDYFNYQQSNVQAASVPDSQTTPPHEDDNVQHRLAGHTPPPRIFQQIHGAGDAAPYRRKNSSTKSKNSNVSHNDRSSEATAPSEKKIFKTLKNKMVEMAHIVQNKFSHKSDKDGKGDSTGEPDVTREDSSPSRETNFYDVPTLRRHYRKARKVTPRYPFYAPDAGSVQSYTKVILQLMEIYSRKLTEVQTMAAEMIAWGDPVKCGRHMEKTLDFAPVSRTRQNLYKEESSEEDEFVPYKPKITMPKKLVKLKGSHSKIKEDPNYVPKHSEDKEKSLHDTETQPFGDHVEKIVDEADVLDNTYPVAPNHQRHEPKIEDPDSMVRSDVDVCLSVEKRKNQPRIKRGDKSDGEQMTDKPDTGFSGRKATLPVTGQVRPVRRTIYTDIPTNPKAVKNKELSDIYSLSDDNSGEEFLSLKRSGGNYRKTRNRHAKLQRKLLERSDSGFSVESARSDDENDDAKHSGKTVQQRVPSPLRRIRLPSPPDFQSESSMDSLSQQSAAMINAQGELYSTQVCLQRERAKTRKPVSKTTQKDNIYSIEEEAESVVKPKKRKQMPSGQSQKEFSKLTKGSSIDSHSDKSNDSAETQEYTGQSSPSVSEKSKEELPILREEPTLVDDMVTPTDSPEGGDQTEKMESQSPNFKKGRGSKNLKIGRFLSDECDKEVSFKDLSEVTDLENIAPAFSMWEPPQQTSINIEAIRRRKRTQKEEKNVQKKRKEELISLVPCPLCNVPFPQDQIEAHAAECEGNEVTNSDSAAIQHNSAEYDDADFDASPSGMLAGGMMDFFKNSQSPQQANSPSPQKRRTVANKLTGEITEQVIRKMMTCYLCDEKLPAGQEYDNHIEICLMEAQQRQAEADARGYLGTSNSAVTPEKRSTRSRMKEEQGSKLLGRLDQVQHQTEGD
ncbi:uncharacterized protein LOC132551873 isoform X2 [Ylistrum balloti]|uniref:uncharacterized protein LOC132551873 isoform X2 n=1 Tax=Ylistrum balloti TaxID=509963 RepID=UPI002905D444|nr:uncharacterized protein LOC132551873 isoform X2 [Ylistrum balloti]